MICRDCREAADAGDGRVHTCADGNRTAGDGRWCDCQHKTGEALNPWTAESLREAVLPLVKAVREVLR